MSQLQTLEEKGKTVSAHLFGSGFQRKLSLALVGAGVTPERMAAIALTECRRTPKLLECSIESLLGAVMECARYGMEPGPMGLCYLIPYGKEVQFQLGYKGLLNLIWQSEQISSVQSEVVYSADSFVYANGIPPELRHVPAEGDRGEPTHVYAIIGTKSGGWVMRVMGAADVEEHRQRYSKDTRKDSAWATAWDEMACKTLLKRAGKRAPISVVAQRAIEMDTRADLGIAQEIDITPPKTEEAEAEEGAAQNNASEPKQGSLT